MMRPLDGVRVLDLTRLLPGAYATLLLADLGADVIKIEDPRGGDGMRTLSPASGRNTFFEPLNRNKRSVTLDLRSPDAAAVLDALASRSDVLVESFRPSTAVRLRVDATSVRRRHPRLICASITGFGHGGPDAQRAAHDINYQAMAGLLRPPDLPGPLIADIGAAMQTAIGILAALLERQQTGNGSVVDVPIQEAASAWSIFPTTADLASACYTLYETADGQWLALGALEPKFWRGFCERIGRADLVPLQHASGDEAARVLREVRTVMRTRTRDEWLALFGGADVCLSPVYTPASAMQVRRTAAAASETRPAPELGADTDALLEEAGVSAADRARLRAARVI
jgi:crotonobetainyl-CoA:carnitine CoA-transferase CaiB-like acyl-CoA transferase